MSKQIQQGKVEFYDPHPGFGGAIVPLPPNMNRLAKYLDGKQDYLDSTLKRIQEEAKAVGGQASAEEGCNYVSFTFRTGPLEHGFCLIKYRRFADMDGEQLTLPFGDLNE